jgi:hypothetical protein
MIVSASRRTDIPAFYSEWFINRLKEGFVYVRNPRNPNRVSSVVLSRNVVDCIVFWTKNPRPMLKQLETIDRMGYPYYFQVTITPYGHPVERGLPGKAEIMKTFKEVSAAIGRHRIIWRYDPVIVSKKFSVQYHLNAFNNMCDILADDTNKCIFSFIDLYTKVRNSMQGINAVNTLEMQQIVQGFAEIAKVHSLALGTCAEAVDFNSYGAPPASCIDPNMIENLIGYPIQGKKDPNQRPACGCIESIDIGAYDSCSHGCIYCYATTSEHTVRNNRQLHDPRSPLLLGHLRGDEIITIRAGNSLKVRQVSLF